VIRLSIPCVGYFWCTPSPHSWMLCCVSVSTTLTQFSPYPPAFLSYLLYTPTSTSALPSRHPTPPTPFVSLFHIHIQRCRQGTKRCAWARRASKPKTSKSFRLWSRRQWLPFCKRLICHNGLLWCTRRRAMQQKGTRIKFEFKFRVEILCRIMMGWKRQEGVGGGGGIATFLRAGGGG